MRLDIHAPIAQFRVAIPRAHAHEIIVAAAEIAQHGRLPLIVERTSHVVRPQVQIVHLDQSGLGRRQFAEPGPGRKCQGAVIHLQHERIGVNAAVLGLSIHNCDAGQVKDITGKSLLRTGRRIAGRRAEGRACRGRNICRPDRNHGRAPGHARRGRKTCRPCQNPCRAADHALPAAPRRRRYRGFEVGVPGVCRNWRGQCGPEGRCGIARICRGIAYVALQRDGDVSVIVTSGTGQATVVDELGCGHRDHVASGRGVIAGVQGGRAGGAAAGRKPAEGRQIRGQCPVAGCAEARQFEVCRVSRGRIRRQVIDREGLAGDGRPAQDVAEVERLGRWPCGRREGGVGVVEDGQVNEQRVVRPPPRGTLKTVP